MMRVLDTTSLEFKEFPDLPDESYAILSHRWGAEEVTYKEYRKNRDTVQHRTGYKKIIEFCHVSRQRGFHYAWVDTCCIDKRSSAELSEAINSMYRWYKKCAQCFVFLEDYNPRDPASLGACEWFSRGWTLQELIASTYCIFFTATWTVIGHKHHWNDVHCPCRAVATEPQQAIQAWGPNLLGDLVAITSIPEWILNGAQGVLDCGVAQRMSWASRRVTTRVEDRAYSLLGIFDINMPLLYGEGPRAFRRLQEEIIRTSNDASIFCFGITMTPTLTNLAQPRYHYNEPIPLFANSPAQFARCEDVTSGTIASDEPYTVTHMGLRVMTYSYISPKLPWRQKEGAIFAIPLACCVGSQSPSGTRPSVDESLFLIVQQLPSRDNLHVFRVDLQSSEVEPPRFEAPHGVDDRAWESMPPRLFYIRI